ncbi:MAG: YifB family Mg chelatase-like AAA ATPase [Holosporales bacterium]|jgi:magnesium chelatase family protein|nr:YifB family Mg chelatase-like AAA ATPase [Holosporales bacterium]
MLSKLATVAFKGVDTQEVSVEVQISPGLPSFTIVGLPDKAVAESKERIRASFSHLALALPQRRITVNLAPADVLKEGAHYDLPIALGIMGALNIFDNEQLQEYIILGGLGLDGLIAPVIGVLPAAIYAQATSRSLVCPALNRNEAIWAGQSLQILAAPDLIALLNHFKGEQLLSQPEVPAFVTTDFTPTDYGDMSDIKGQQTLKRAMEIAAVGRHNVLMVGPPGAGKSMISQRLMGILPPLSPLESIEITMIYSIAGMLPEKGLVVERPFRSQHHSASLISIVGGGIRAKPGEISLAHNGVLFLDELPEFSRATLEALRQPLESGNITVTRANQHVTYPAKIQLVAAMNPCRCGFYGTAQRECSRAPKCAFEYQSKLSGPLLDRFDLILYVPQLPLDDLMASESKAPAEKSETIQKRVCEAVAFGQVCEAKIKEKTGATIGGGKTDAAPSRSVTKIENLDEKSQRFFRQIAEKRQLSARGCYRVMKVSRTIADLAKSEDVLQEHIYEAINYRYVLDARS